MSEAYIVGAVALTSVVAYLLGRFAVGLASGALSTALRRAAECVGIGVLFVAANVLAQVLLVLLMRVVSGGFVSLYFVDSSIIVPLSCLQGLALWWWRAITRSRGD